MVFDTETTGLFDNRTVKLDQLPEIIEIYATTIDLDTGEVGETIHSLVKPRKPLVEKTTTITGITPEMLADAPSFSEIADKLIGLLEKADAVIAHNATFDCDMVEIELERIGRKIKWPQTICTVEQSMHYPRNRKSVRLKLSELYEFLFPGERFVAHRADSDVNALVRICVEMRKRGDL